jgi:hypothetical protein
MQVQIMLQIFPRSEEPRGPPLLLTKMREKLSSFEVDEREDTETPGAQTRASAERLEGISRAAGLEGTNRTTSKGDREFCQLCHSARGDTTVTQSGTDNRGDNKASRFWAELIGCLYSKTFADESECVIYFSGTDICIERTPRVRTLRLTPRFETRTIRLSWEKTGGEPGTRESLFEIPILITTRDDGQLEVNWRKLPYTSPAELSEALISFVTNPKQDR